MIWSFSILNSIRPRINKKCNIFINKQKTNYLRLLGNSVKLYQLTDETENYKEKNICSSEYLLINTLTVKHRYSNGSQPNSSKKEQVQKKYRNIPLYLSRRLFTLVDNRNSICYHKTKFRILLVVNIKLDLSNLY